MVSRTSDVFVLETCIKYGIFENMQGGNVIIGIVLLCNKCIIIIIIFPIVIFSDFLLMYLPDERARLISSSSVYFWC